MRPETRGPTRREILRAALGLGVVGCHRFQRVNHVIVGEVAARSGPRALWGEDLHRGIELAIAQQNARGGLNGRTIRLVVADDESHEERASALATRLIDREGAMVLFGEPSSAATEKAALAAQRRGVVFVSPATTARDVTRAGDMVFRTALLDTEQTAALARFARQTLQKRRAATVYRRSSLLHVGMADEFGRSFRGAGGEMVLRESYDDDDVVRLVGRVRASGADAVYIPADTADAARMAQLLRQGRVTAQVLGSDGWSSSEVRRLARDAAIGVIFCDAFTYASTRPEVESFVTAFRERYHAQPGTFAALGYDAARWVLQTAARLRRLDARALRDALSGSRLDDAVAGAFSVDARRSLTRVMTFLRYTRDGVEIAGTHTP
jgi:branched-chain amino acid transport system substrate-binding protein